MLLSNNGSLFSGIYPSACAAQGKGFSCCVWRNKKGAIKSGWTLKSYIIAKVDLLKNDQSFIMLPFRLKY